MNQFFKTKNFFPKMLFNPLKQSRTLFSLPTFNYRLVRLRTNNEDFEREREEYKKKLKEYRKMHYKKFWEDQTQIENRYLMEWRETKIEKQKRDLDKWRTHVCKIAMHTKN